MYSVPKANPVSGARRKTYSVPRRGLQLLIAEATAHRRKQLNRMWSSR